MITKHVHRRWRRIVVLAAATLAFVAPSAVGVASAQSAPTTIVSLTFDDGNASQMNALPIMAKYGFKGTFYLISGVVDTQNYVTRADIETIAAQGHEIGGHTVNHPDLATVPAAEAKRQICNDRATLTDWGYEVTSLAYPYASANSAVEDAARACGYNTARGLGDIASAHGCAGCWTSESVPPDNPYWLKAVDMIDDTWTLQEMQDVVVTAEQNGGGVVPFTFHHVCDGCDSLTISPATFDAFLAWLSEREGQGTVVRTIDEAFGGAVQPVVREPVPSDTVLGNTSLESSTGGTDVPDCWTRGGWGTNTATFTRSTDARTGSYSQRVDITGYVDGDAKLLPTMDLGSCAPSASPGVAYNLGTWYKSDGTTQFALYYRNAAGTWAYWTSSPWFASADTWTEATWTTPPAPAGTTGISFGLSLISNGSVTTDDYSFAPSTSGS
ncbi:polysaccharide deacetylase family protein [Saccharomonospora sp. NPDC046836]|uniref:polysaccharide deacetylase family protein n=1 Tax=Saccharomonospora sp. NPDC046836 TaxID=3156921 RepID=UPI0033C06FB0